MRWKKVFDKIFFMSVFNTGNFCVTTLKLNCILCNNMFLSAFQTAFCNQQTYLNLYKVELLQLNLNVLYSHYHNRFSGVSLKYHNFCIFCPLLNHKRVCTEIYKTRLLSIWL